MKRNVFFLAMSGLLLLGSCQKKFDRLDVIQEDLSLDIAPLSITDPNDPNLDANWNFSDPNVTTTQIYYGQRANNQPVSSVEVTLPWFTAGNPANNEDRDYRPELGWVLYLKDFGTPERPTQTPFFALYNKYSGVLRFFVYNYRVRNQGEPSKTYYVAELGFNNAANYNASLSFFAPTDEFVKNNTNPSTKQIVVTKKDASDTWLNFDFVMTYDTKYSELKLTVYGASQADLALGTDFSTLNARSSVGGAGVTSDFHNAMTKGYEYIGSTKSLLDAINDLLGKRDSNKSASQYVVQSEAASGGNVAPQSVVGTVAAAVGVVQSVVGLIRSFSGGKKSTVATQTVYQYSGIVQTTGTATITNNLYSIQFHQDPKAPLTANRYRPIYQYDTGLIGAPDRFHLFARGTLYDMGCYFYRMRDLHLFTYNTAFRFDKFVDAFYHNPDLLGKVKLVKFDTYLVNNIISEIGLGSEYNSFDFLQWADASLNGGVTGDSPHSLPVNADRRRDIDDAQITYGRYIHPLITDNYNPFPTRLNHPKIGIEIHYEIIDPNYPLEDSRERVIFKVVDLTTFDFTPHTGRPLDYCPQPFEHFY
ncbi:hypothetical protein JHJ32_17475 [Parapedobacter sp. ISTM3]|uniref:Uncharacterized protein n=1 Tax=Parapedobacter luteus TaxID=623280 RepID=A0A1T5AIA9_9SPHI|nr:MULTISPECIES: hypothetical protein [Parapedobacter]MBK1441794.1 hypothetical protein [Parapedobacter sp. ISTM3]SKB34497.1 hypothetical protein SAMN05660226_00775 [Parapedobacter luteus]